MPSIRDFSGGVLNQELQNRDNGNGVLFDCKNVLSSWNGELRKRTGTKLLKELDGNSKIIPYRLPDGNDMIMLLKDGKIDCYSFDEFNNLNPYYEYIYGNNMNFPMNNWSSATHGNWTISGNGLPPAGSYYNIYEVFSDITSVFGGYSYSIDTIRSKEAYFQILNSNDNFVLRSFHAVWVTEVIGDNSSAYVWGTEPIIQFSDDGNTWNSVKTNSFNFKKNYFYNKNYLFGTGFNIYEYDVEVAEEVSSHRYWRMLFTNYTEGDQEQYLNEYGCFFELRDVQCYSSVGKTVISFNNLPYSSEDFNNIRWSQNGNSLMLVSKGKRPFEIKRSAGQLVCDQFVPDDYSSLWTSIGNPACVTYYQNRLWFGGFDLFPTRVYGSAFGEFNKFQIPSPILATSPIVADGTEISNIIENMWGGNNALYCLSEDGISMIDAQNALVATNQVEFKLRNREPVNSMTPTVKDDIMIYLGRDKRKILATDYDLIVQRFRANCLSDNYNSFFQSGVKEIHYIPRRSSLIYGTLEDGKWFALLFDLSKGKNALYPFETQGSIIDVQPIKYGSETKLIMITQLPSNQYVVEEKMPQADQKIMDFMTEEEKKTYTNSIIGGEHVYLDHFIPRETKSPASIIGNLPYQAGQKIEVIADGQYLGEHEILSRNTDTLYAWKFQSEYKQDILYTDIENPTVNSVLFDSNGSNMSSYVIDGITETSGVGVTSIGVKRPVLSDFFAYKNNDDIVYNISGNMTVYDEDNTVLGVATSISDLSLVFNGTTYTRDSSYDRESIIDIVYIYYREDTEDATISVFYVQLEEPVSNVVVGYKYDSYAVLKFVTPYTERKYPKEIAVNFINTGYLEVGNTFNSLKSVLNNLVESVNISNKKILMNGNYTKTLDKQTFETPYVIVRSDKGLPFIITGIDYKVDMSNYQGGV